jgi:16S rRNA U1498 N3-methylase RsmE
MQSSRSGSMSPESIERANSAFFQSSQTLVVKIDKIVKNLDKVDKLMQQVIMQSDNSVRPTVKKLLKLKRDLNEQLDSVVSIIEDGQESREKRHKKFIKNQTRSIRSRSKSKTRKSR